MYVWHALPVCQGHTVNTSNALTQLQEAQVHRVVSNHLYNNIISKLVKARKGYYALELFELMKPGCVVKLSSIPYCAVIGVCVCVGDIHSAETLFAETSIGYRLRVPPLNIHDDQAEPQGCAVFSSAQRVFRPPHTRMYLQATHERLHIESVEIKTMEQTAVLAVCPFNGYRVYIDLESRKFIRNRQMNLLAFMYLLLLFLGGGAAASPACSRAYFNLVVLVECTFTELRGEFFKKRGYGTWNKPIFITTLTTSAGWFLILNCIPGQAEGGQCGLRACVTSYRVAPPRARRHQGHQAGHVLRPVHHGPEKNGCSAARLLCDGFPQVMDTAGGDRDRPVCVLVFERHAKVPYGIACQLAYAEVPGTNGLLKDMDKLDWVFLLRVSLKTVQLVHAQIIEFSPTLETNRKCRPTLSQKFPCASSFAPSLWVSQDPQLENPSGRIHASLPAHDNILSTSCAAERSLRLLHLKVLTSSFQHYLFPAEGDLRRVQVLVLSCDRHLPPSARWLRICYMPPRSASTPPYCFMINGWAKFTFMPELFRYIYMDFLPELVVRLKSRDDE
ncbi:hypothetical protein B0H11DRAFT_1918244 [Mycena galericulata]|nr:hypothetical protein B0H11DRAFT_1918244 [Mycena galericulata]